MPPLPIPSNTTCDIYRTGHTPPAAPDVASVSIALQWASTNQKYVLQTGAAQPIYDYIAYCPLGTDIRDNGGSGSGSDTIYVPNKNGTPYTVIWVERLTTAAGDVLAAYLTRGTTTFPTDQV